MDSRQLRYFTAVCRFRNLSHAADHCNVAASAISHHVAALEAELDTRLFTRKPRGMEPTAAGLKLEEHARAILAAMEAAETDIRHGQAEVSGEIGIGMPYSVISVIGGGVMRSVLEDYPKVRLVLREALSGNGYRALRTGEVEAALIFNPPADSGTDRIALIEEELCCIGHPDILGPPRDAPIPLAELTRFPLALLQSGVLSRALVDRPADLARLEAGARMQLASIAGTLVALRERLACTLAPQVLVADEIASGALVARRVSAPSLVRTLYFVTAKTQRPSHLREAMTGLILGQVREAVESGRWPGARLVATGGAQSGL